MTQLLFLATAVGFWVLYKSYVQPSDPMKWGLALLGVAWFSHLLLTMVNKDHFALSALALGPVLLMLWRKPPDAIAVRRTLDFFSFAVIGAYLAQRALEQLGVGVVQSGIFFRTPFMFDIFGPTPKWQGPFGHVAEAAALGAFLLVYGINRRGFPAWFFSLMGLLMLVMAEQRAALVAAVIGIGVTLIFRKRRGSMRLRWLLLAFLAFLVIGTTILVASVTAPVVGMNGVNGRSDIWPAFFQLWMTSPLVGVGQSGIEQLSDPGFFVNGVFVAGVPHGHNLSVDVLGRYGLLGVVPVIAFCVSLCVVCAKAANRGAPSSLALVSVFLTISLAETNLDFRYTSISMTVVHLTFMLGAAPSTSATALNANEQNLHEARAKSRTSQWRPSEYD